MRGHVAGTARPEVIGGIGGFAGLFDARKLAAYRRPVLATSTDGVGTKVVIASRLGRYDTVGIDLVAMVADDLVACGAEPLFLTDYMVCGSVVPERVAAIVSGVADGCAQAGCALLGGETAEHPGHLGPDDFDLAGAATGVAEADELLGPDRVRPGDAVIAMASSGLHCNGFSLVRMVLDRAGLALDAELPELAGPLGEELLDPARIYAPDCLALARACDVHAYAHITGGGAGRQPGPGAAAGHRRRARSRQLAPAAGVRRARRARPGGPGRDGAGLQHGRGHGGRGRGPGRGPGGRPAHRPWRPRLAGRGSHPGRRYPRHRPAGRVTSGLTARRGRLAGSRPGLTAVRPLAGSRPG